MNHDVQREYYRLVQEVEGLELAPGYVWANKKEVLSGYRPVKGKPFRGLVFREMPKFFFDKKEGHGRLWDAYLTTTTFWLISQRLKVLLEQSCLGRFAFQKVEVDYNGQMSEGDAYWLCDFVDYLDCVDEEKSDIEYQDDVPFKNYLELKSVVLKEDVEAQSHAFRLQYSPLTVIVDDVFVAAMRKHGVVGFDFIKLSK